MATLSPQQCLQRLRQLYRDAIKVTPANDQAVIDWAKQPELWATHQVKFRGWSYAAAEAVVRACRIYCKRAAMAASQEPQA